MIIIACPQCRCALRTVGEDAEQLLGKETDYYPDRYPCSVCPSKARIIDGREAKEYLDDIRDLTPQEVFAALHGLGFPEEQDCGETAVQQALRRSPLRRAATRHVRNGRCCLDRLELEDGTRLFIGSSSYGAVVYRIAEPHSYTQTLLNRIQRDASTETTGSGEEARTGG